MARSAENSTDDVVLGKKVVRVPFGSPRCSRARGERAVAVAACSGDEPAASARDGEGGAAPPSSDAAPNYGGHPEASIDVELGTGSASFVALENGDQIAMVRGKQGFEKLQIIPMLIVTPRSPVRDLAVLDVRDGLDRRGLRRSRRRVGRDGRFVHDGPSPWMTFGSLRAAAAGEIARRSTPAAVTPLPSPPARRLGTPDRRRAKG
jgi:hypothetical protein